MALSKEDHKDVKGALGKALANKVSKVTRDSNNSMPHDHPAMKSSANARFLEAHKRTQASRDYMKQPSSLVKGQTKGQLNKDIMSGAYAAKHNKGQGLK